MFIFGHVAQPTGAGVISRTTCTKTNAISWCAGFIKKFLYILKGDILSYNPIYFSEISVTSAHFSTVLLYGKTHAVDLISTLKLMSLCYVQYLCNGRNIFEMLASYATLS